MPKQQKKGQKSRKPRPKSSRKPSRNTVTPAMIVKFAKPAKRIGKRLSRAQPRVAAERSGGVKIAASLANPSGTPNLRLTVLGDTLPTATALLHDITSYVCSDQYGTYLQQVPLGAMPIALFRDPLRSVVQFFPNPLRKTYSYKAAFYPSDLDLSDAVVQPISPLWFDRVTEAVPATSSTAALVADDTNVHGSVLYVGTMKQAADTRFVWMDIGVIMTLRLALVQPSQEGVGTMEVLRAADCTGNVDVTDTVFAAMPSTVIQDYIYICAVPGYYGFRFKPISRTVGLQITDMRLYGSSNALPIIPPALSPAPNHFGDMFSHRSAPSMGSHLATMRKVRVNATSILVTPVANMLNVNGTIHALYSTDTVNWLENLQQDDISKVGGEADFLWARRKAADGMYAFLKPSGINDFAYHTGAAMSGDGKIKDCSYPLDANTGVLNIVATLSTAGTVVVGGAFEVTIISSLEWVPVLDQWWECHLSQYGSLALIDALDHLRLIPNFYDNPIHLAAIKAGLQRAYRFTKANRGKFAGALSALFPSFAGAFGAGSALLGAMPEW